MMLEDWIKDDDRSYKESYTRTIPLDSLGGSGLSTNGGRFLLKLRDLIYTLDPDCLLQVCAEDEKRKEIYKKAFKNMKNVKFN